MGTTKDKGIKRVKENNTDDYIRIYGFAQDWVKTTIEPFTSEDLKLAYESLNGPPRQPNVYGAVMNNLSKDKLIRANAFVYAKLKAAHSRLIHQWIAA